MLLNFDQIPKTVIPHMRGGEGQAVARQVDRVSQLEEPTKEQLMELLPEDLEEVE